MASSGNSKARDLEGRILLLEAEIARMKTQAAQVQTLTTDGQGLKQAIVGP